MFARLGLPGLDYIRAITRDEVVGILQQHSGNASLMMGGTDLFPRAEGGPVPS